MVDTGPFKFRPKVLELEAADTVSDMLELKAADTILREMQLKAADTVSEVLELNVMDTILRVMLLKAVNSNVVGHREGENNCNEKNVKEKIPEVQSGSVKSRR